MDEVWPSKKRTVADAPVAAGDIRSLSRAGVIEVGIDVDGVCHR